ncbi:Two-component response regulator ARR2, partial [Mucuna pruriens]
MTKFSNDKKVLCQFPAGLRVLGVDSDPTALEIINQMCFPCHYRVTTFSDSQLALNYVREKYGCIDVILIEVHMPNMDGYKFLKHVSKEINVPVVMMSLDDSTSAVMKAIRHGACDYWIKPLHENQFKIMWKYVAKKFWSENKLPKKDSEFGFFVTDATMKNKKKSSSNSQECDVDEPATKKSPVVWTAELHHQFVKAVMQLGLDEAQPKKILEVMKIPDLTKEQVASHLQKYRLNLKICNGMTLKQNEMASENTTSYISYETLAGLHPEELISYLRSKREPMTSFPCKASHGICSSSETKCPTNIANANNFLQSITPLDDLGYIVKKILYK